MYRRVYLIYQLEVGAKLYKGSSILSAECFYDICVFALNIKNCIFCEAFYISVGNEELDKKRMQIDYISCICSVVSILNLYVASFFVI